MIKYFLSKRLFLFFILFSPFAQADAPYSRLFIFGDSLSDTGNLASIVGVFPPPFYMNRISNGPVSVDVLAAKLGLSADASLHLIGPEVGGNYAVARANASGVEVIDLTAQVISFNANHGFIAPADALYVIFIGGNDIRAARNEIDLEAAKLIVQQAAEEVQLAIENLLQIGARSFLLVNSPNIGLIPETGLLAEATNNPDLVKRTRKLSNLYRELLDEIAEQLEEENDIEISEFDFYKFFNKVVKKSDKYGFINATDACFSLDTFSFHPDCNFGLNFDQFVFFDEIHPTSRVHALIGEAMYQSLENDND